MATRIEKIFRTNTINTMNLILNEVSECVENLKKQKQIPKHNIADSLMKVAQTIDKFFIKHNISDEEITNAIKKGK